MTIGVDAVGTFNDNPKSCVSFEETLNLTGFGKFNILSMIFCAFVLLGMILETVGLSYIIPGCQCDLGVTQAQKGWLAAIPFICIIITSHLWGYLADTRGRKKILVFTMSAGSFFSLLSSFSPDLITFAGLRFVAGIFIAAPAALGYTYLGEINPAKYRDMMIILGNVSVGIGTAIVPLIAWGVLPLDFYLDLGFLPAGYRPWRLLVSLFALPYAFCAIFFFKFPESPKFLQAQGQSDEALKILKRIYAMNFKKNPEDFPITSFKCECEPVDHTNNSVIKDLWIQTIPLFSRNYIWYTASACILQFGTFAMTNGIYIWNPTILNQLFENTKTDAYDDENLCSVYSHINVSISNATDGVSGCNDVLNTTTFPVSIALACLVSGFSIGCAFLLNILGKKNILIAIFFITATCNLILHWVTNTALSIVVFSLIQISGSSIGVTSAFVIEVFPTNVRAMAVSLTMMAGRMGSVFGTNLIGYLIDENCPTTFFVFSGLLYFCFIVCITLPRNVNK